MLSAFGIDDAETEELIQPHRRLRDLADDVLLDPVVVAVEIQLRGDNLHRRGHLGDPGCREPLPAGDQRRDHRRIGVQVELDIVDLRREVTRRR